jgi:probable HAF family extracellular repeat protein
VGQYADANGTFHGFLLSGGSFTTLDAPGSTLTLALGINDAGQIVGEYEASGRFHGFLLSGGSFTTLDPPGSTFTNALGINNVGQIVGLYSDASGRTHGFLATSVPEPGSLTLLGLGALGLIVSGHRRRTNPPFDQQAPRAGRNVSPRLLEPTVLPSWAGSHPPTDSRISP